MFQITYQSLLPLLHCLRMDPNHSFHSSSSMPFLPRGRGHNFMNVPPILAPCIRHSSHEFVGAAKDNSPTWMELQRRHLQLFWQQQMLEVNQIEDFKHHQLPIARMKRIMKSDENVKMISADTPILFSKACEFFILDLTLRSWLHTQEKNRRILQRCDIASAITHAEFLDFLLEVVPADENKEDEEDDGNSNNINKQEELSQQSMTQRPMSSSGLSIFGHPQ